jgi:hypothetical protein
MGNSTLDLEGVTDRDGERTAVVSHNQNRSADVQADSSEQIAERQTNGAIGSKCGEVHESGVALRVGGIDTAHHGQGVLNIDESSGGRIQRLVGRPGGAWPME